MKICLKNLNMYITDDNIDDLIKQYHVNYYENIFGEDDTPGAKFQKLFEHMVLSEYDV